MQTHLTSDYLASQRLNFAFVASFFERINITESCWLWTGGKKEPGSYGRILIPGTHKFMRAHIASWILHFGPIPTGQKVCHDCPRGDNKGCVNPAHLWLGTQADNMQDAVEKGLFANRTGEDAGNSKLTWEIVRKIRSDFSTTPLTMLEIADRLSITRNQVWSIIKGHSWLDAGYTYDKSKICSKTKTRSTFGESHPFRKLTDDSVREILNLCRSGTLSHPEIAVRFGINISVVSRINTGSTWKHITKQA